MTWALVVLSLTVSSGAAQNPQPPAAAQPAQSLQELRLEGASIFTQDDVLWLLKLREGAPLPAPPDEIAKSLQERYQRDGYSEARVTAAYEDGRLTLTVDEGRIDAIEILGVTPEQAARFLERLQIKPGDIYNKRAVGHAAGRLTAESEGAFEIGQPRASQPGSPEGEKTPDEIILERRGGRNVLVIPLLEKTHRFNTSLGSGREDIYTSVDGFGPAIGLGATIFDHSRFNHTYVNGYVSYKFSRDDPSYSAGFERPIFGGPRLFLGAEVHDITASDDLWRLSPEEASLVALGFKNSFRDYYRRRGQQIFGVFRMGANNELSAMARWDRHEPLENATDFSIFRDDATFRPNPQIQDQHVNALVFGYTFDTRPLTAAGRDATYVRHLKDSLFGTSPVQSPGLRLEWTSEVAGHGMGGDAEFDRHILNARGYLPLGPRTLLSGRGLFGFSNGTLPIERRFALGGIGSVRGYSFKEWSGTGMTLMNVEYLVNLTGPVLHDNDGLSVYGFYDAGRVGSSFEKPGSSSPWLQGVGFGVGLGSLRIDFGYRTEAIPRSLQVLVRFSPTF